MKTSWKTSAAGLATFFAALAAALKAATDNDPTTVPDWTLVAVSAGPAIMGLFARDNNVTSEQAGAATTTPGPAGAGSQAAMGLIAIGLALGLTGCAHAFQEATDRTTTTLTNGTEIVTVRTVKSRITAVGDAKQSIAAMNAKNTKTTQSIGTSGLSEETSGTNAVAALVELRRIAEAMPK